MKKFYSMWIRSWTCVSQSIASSTIVRPPPCTTRCIFKVHITYFISDSVAIGRRFNAGSKKEDCTLSSGSIHTFSYQNVSKKQPLPPWPISLIHISPLNVRCLPYQAFLVHGHHLTEWKRLTVVKSFIAV